MCTLDIEYGPSVHFFLGSLFTYELAPSFLTEALLENEHGPTLLIGVYHTRSIGTCLSEVILEFEPVLHLSVFTRIWIISLSLSVEYGLPHLILMLSLTLKMDESWKCTQVHM